MRARVALVAGGMALLALPAGGGARGGGVGETAAPEPELGVRVVVRPVRGKVSGRPPGGRRFIPIEERRAITTGWTLDTTGGTVELTSASDKRGGTQSAQFNDGFFRIAQERSARAVTELTLKGGSFRACPARARVSARARVVRRLWGRGLGRFRTRARSSATTIRGTTWLTEDRCDGTLTRVRTGSVTVRDFARRRTVTVRAGQTYLARAP